MCKGRKSELGNGKPNVVMEGQRYKIWSAWIDTGRHESHSQPQLPSSGFDSAYKLLRTHTAAESSQLENIIQMSESILTETREVNIL